MDPPLCSSHHVLFVRTDALINTSLNRLASWQILLIYQENNMEDEDVITVIMISICLLVQQVIKCQQIAVLGASSVG